MDESQKSESKIISNVVLVNLILLIIYTLYLRISYGSSYSRNYAFILDSFFIGIQVIACLIIAIFTKPKDFLISAGLVLVIGFATCVVGI